MGSIVGIATRDKERGEMVVYAASRVTLSKGIGDDHHGAQKGDRQVTVMTKESWDAVCKDLGRQLYWSMRRANLLIEGIDLKDTTGMLLKVDDFFLEITGECKPGGRMDEEFVGLKDALTPDWRGGVTCKVLTEGGVQEGDTVLLGEKSYM